MKNMYIVGGAVRDVILNARAGYISKPMDVDYVVVGETVEAMMEAYGEPIGKDFPVWLNQYDEEVALARVERSLGDGYNDFACTTEGVTLEDDLGRRDLTINSMAVPVEEQMWIVGFDGKADTNIVIDPYNGLQDIEDKVLRHTSDAFAEDPLRVLRLARFYARYKHLGFTVAPETFELCQEMVAKGMLKALPKERIWAETFKALSGGGAEMYFKFLSDVGFCAIQRPNELWGLATTKHTRAACDDFELKRWVAFDQRNSFTDTFGAPKKFDSLSARSLILNSAYMDAESVVYALSEVKAYHESPDNEIILESVRDAHMRAVYRRVLERSRDVKVDIPQGPEYGNMLRKIRIGIAHSVIFMVE